MQHLQLERANGHSGHLSQEMDINFAATVVVVLQA